MEGRGRFEVHRQVARMEGRGRFEAGGAHLVMRLNCVTQIACERATFAKHRRDRGRSREISGDDRVRARHLREAHARLRGIREMSGD